jgi:hypothetical protein
MSYNGWKNYETWCVHLWLTNEEGTYFYCVELAKECRKAAPSDERVRDRIWPEADAAKFLLSDRLKDYVEDHNPLREDATLYGDLVHAALSEVDWHEVAEAFLEE